jgi:hypothetical protein
MIDRNEPSPHIVTAAPASDEHQYHLLADALRIWLLCDRARCRRAWRCCGRALDCVPRLGPRVPMAVRRDFAEYSRRRKLGLSPELAAVTRAEDQTEVEAWFAARPARRRRGRGRDREQTPSFPRGRNDKFVIAGLVPAIPLRNPAAVPHESRWPGQARP